MELTKRCLACKDQKPLTNFKEQANVCRRCDSRRFLAQLKLDMLETLGWKCACCGESHPAFLSLDHINNDGGEHRKRLSGNSQAGGTRTLSEARREGWPKDKYQLLCMNCNTAKQKYGVCPHKSGLSAQKVIEDLKSRIFKIGNDHRDYSKGNRNLAIGWEAKKALAAMNFEKELKFYVSKLSPQELSKLLDEYKISSE